MYIDGGIQISVLSRTFYSSKFSRTDILLHPFPTYGTLILDHLLMDASYCTVCHH